MDQVRLVGVASLAGDQPQSRAAGSGARWLAWPPCAAGRRKPGSSPERCWPTRAHGTWRPRGPSPTGRSACWNWPPAGPRRRWSTSGPCRTPTAPSTSGSCSRTLPSSSRPRPSSPRRARDRAARRPHPPGRGDQGPAPAGTGRPLPGPGRRRRPRAAVPTGHCPARRRRPADGAGPHRVAVRRAPAPRAAPRRRPAPPAGGAGDLPAPRHARLSAYTFTCRLAYGLTCRSAWASAPVRSS